MSRTTINFFLDAALLAVFVALMWCAVVVRFVFPPGPNTLGWTLWGLDYMQWTTIQFGLIATLALGVLVHLMLHWTWVCSVASGLLRPDRSGDEKKVKMDDGIRTLYGVGLLIVILNLVGLGVAAATLSLIGPP